MEEFAKQVFDTVKGKMEGAWDKLSEDQQDSLKRASKRMAELTAKSLTGKDVSAELALVEATLYNFEVAGIMRARSALLEAIEEVAGNLGKVARKFLLG